MRRPRISTYERHTFAMEKTPFMLTDYRTWLESELKLLGNASHHAYSLGQANMAKRAIERLDQELSGRTLLALSPGEADAVAKALETLLESSAGFPPALADLRERLQAARGPA